jgi:hypothetical protein
MLPGRGPAAAGCKSNRLPMGGSGPAAATLLARPTESNAVTLVLLGYDDIRRERRQLRSERRYRSTSPEPSEPQKNIAPPRVSWDEFFNVYNYLSEY